MTQLYATKDLNSLFKIVQKRGHVVYGFDILNESRLTRFDAKNVIRFNLDNKMMKNLFKNEQVQLEIAELCFNKAEDQAKYLGLTERTLFRMKSRSKTCCTT